METKPIKFICCIVILFLSINSYAQVKDQFQQVVRDVSFEAEFSLGLADMTPGDINDNFDVKYAPKITFTIGAHVVKPLNDISEVSLGLRYRSSWMAEKFKTDVDFVEAEVKRVLRFDYLEIPISYNDYPGWQIAGREVELGMGLVPAFNLGARSQDNKVTKNVHVFNLFLEGKVVTELTDRIDVGLDGRFGLINTYNTSKGQHMFTGNIRTHFKF